MLEIKNVSKVYNKGANAVYALNNVNISFEEQGLVFIVGKSGSGKSTLLNVLGGLDSMSEGEIIIDGRSTSKFKARDFDAFRNYYVGFIFQEFNLIDEISIYENIAISLKIQAKKHNINLIDDVLKKVGLENLGYRKPNELSSGQRQRISVARALIKDPKIILADEPTGALDSNTGEELIASLKELSKNKLVIVVSHDEDLAYKYADRIIKLSDGYVVDDIIRIEETTKPKIEKLGSNVFKIENGEELNEELVNKHLKDNELNYICLTNDMEKTVLAYPKTFEKVYSNSDYKNMFKKNDKVYKASEVTKKKLPKTGIKLKETIKMAFASYKRKKGRLIMMIISSVIGIGMLLLSLSLGNVDRKSIMVNTITNDTKMVELSKKSEKEDYFFYYGSNIKFTNSDYKYLDDNFPSISFAPRYKYNLKFNSGYINHADLLYLHTFIGAAEINDVSDLGLEMVAGTSNTNDYNSIIISDYAAYSLNRYGFLGKDKEGNYKLVKEDAYTDLIGSEILLMDNLYFKISGIFKTNYEKYFSLYSEYDFATENEFKNLKSLYYDYVFVKEGFTEDLSTKTELDFNQSYYFSFGESENENYGAIFDVESGSKLLETLKAEDIIYGDLSSPLATNEIIVDEGVMRVLLMDFETPNITSQMIETYLATHNISGMITTIDDKAEAYVIKGVIKQKDQEIFVSDDKMALITEHELQSSSLIFNPHDTVSLALALDKFFSDDYIVSLGGMDSSYLFERLFSSFSIVFRVLGIIFAIFAFFIIFAFISNSVKARRKEIGILRASGAKRKDIILIFFSEIFMVAAVVCVLACLLIAYVNADMNELVEVLFTDIKVFKLKFSDILLAILMTSSLYFVSSIIPLQGVIYGSPIKTINKE